MTRSERLYASGPPCGSSQKILAECLAGDESGPNGSEASRQKAREKAKVFSDQTTPGLRSGFRAVRNRRSWPGGRRWLSMCLQNLAKGHITYKQAMRPSARPRCDKGNPAVRRVRKATDLSEVAGLPNRGECMRRYIGFLAVAAVDRPGRSPARTDSPRVEQDTYQRHGATGPPQMATWPMRNGRVAYRNTLPKGPQ